MAIAREQLQRMPLSSDVLESSPSPDTLLEGTGNALWQALYRAAEAFAQQSAYPSSVFPALNIDAQCVLCQQKYSADAADRLLRFARFVNDSATSNAQAAHKARLDALTKVQSVDLSVLDAPALAEVAERLPELHAAIIQAKSTWVIRHA